LLYSDQSLFEFVLENQPNFLKVNIFGTCVYKNLKGINLVTFFVGSSPSCPIRIGNRDRLSEAALRRRIYFVNPNYGSGSKTHIFYLWLQKKVYRTTNFSPFLFCCCCWIRNRHPGSAILLPLYSIIFWQILMSKFFPVQ
jgi:hypothetical protein